MQKVAPELFFIEPMECRNVRNTGDIPRGYEVLHRESSLIDPIRLRAYYVLVNCLPGQIVHRVPRSISLVERRRAAVGALGIIGPAALEAVPILTETLGDPSPEMRGRALYALTQIAE